jgi:drug/metabolite transporter (DMT)-like permease
VTRLWLAFGTGVAGLSLAGLFVRWALPAPPLVTGFYRVAVAAAVLAAVLAWRGRGMLPAGRCTRLAVAAGLCFGADIALWHLALVRTSLANATLLVNTTPIFIGAFLLTIRRERLGRRFWVSAGLALAGAALLLGSSPAAGSTRSGDLLALAAAAFYSGYLLLVKGARQQADTVSVLAVTSAAAAVLLGIAALAAGDPLRGFPVHSWTAMLGAALLAQIGGVLGIVWALRWLRAPFAAVALLGQPIGTALLAWWLFDEAISALQGVGGAAVLVAIVLTSRDALDPAATRR